MTAPKTKKFTKGGNAAPRTSVKTNLKNLVTTKGVDFFDEDLVEESLGGAVC